MFFLLLVSGDELVRFLLRQSNVPRLVQCSQDLFAILPKILVVDDTVFRRQRNSCATCLDASLHLDLEDAATTKKRRSVYPVDALYFNLNTL